VIVSDDAGQFNVGRHALCWVHAERLVHKLDTFTDEQRSAQDRIRAAIWTLYGDLKNYRQCPTPQRKAALAPHNEVGRARSPRLGSGRSQRGASSLVIASPKMGGGPLNGLNLRQLEPNRRVCPPAPARRQVRANREPQHGGRVGATVPGASYMRHVAGSGSRLLDPSGQTC
jgi:hypothetical protein